MKRIFILCVFGVVAVLLAIAAYFWFALANTAMEIVANNIRIAQQQLLLAGQGMGVEYHSLKIGSDGIYPAIIVEEPTLILGMNSATYFLSAPELRLTASFAALDRFTVTPPEELRLDKRSATGREGQVWRVLRAPEVLLQSQNMPEKGSIQSIIIDAFKVQKNKKLVLEFEGLPPLSYTPPMHWSLGWQPLRYDSAARVQQFSRQLEEASNAKRTLLP